MKRGILFVIVLIVVALALMPRRPNNLKDRIAWAIYDLRVSVRKPNPPEVQQEYDEELVM